jgi:EmrB/QacA subfamily drug resistance transporter
MTTATTPAPRRGVGLRSERGPVLAALMLSVALVALDSTIIATAVPSVVRDLGGFSQFPWLFSIYLLTQAVTVPLYGKYADMVGRRPLMFFGIAAFLLGSVLCGVAWNMQSLIAFRAIQGIGAGAVQPISMTIVGDLYSVAERARVQGYIASVWGAASVIGPTVGGVFSQYLSWRWIFFVNLPVGALAAWMLARNFREKVTPRRHHIDVTGAALLTGGCSLAIVALLEGGVAWPWGSAPGALVAGSAVLMLVAFVAVERRAVEPILPLWVFRRRITVGANLASLAVGAVLIGLSSFVPAFVQGVLGHGALVAGFTLASLTVGWPLAAAYAGRVYMRIGFRDTALIGVAFVSAGVILCALLGPAAALWKVGGSCFIVGVGLGFTASPLLVAVQSVVGWDRRGMVTGTNMFFRSLGSAVGAALFGAIANATLADEFAHPSANLAGALPQNVDATRLVFATQGAVTHSPVADFIRTALYQASHNVFLTLVGVAMVMWVAVLVVPRRTEPLVFD